jgi:translation initiation factor IF-1
MVQKKKKNVNRTVKSNERELIFKEGDSQYYAHIISALGDRRFQLVLDDPLEQTYSLSVGKLRGNIKRNNRVVSGGLVLCTSRFGEVGKCDIIHNYIEAHQKLLRKYGELDSLDRKVRAYTQETSPGYTGGAETLDDEFVDFEDIEDI